VSAATTLAISGLSFGIVGAALIWRFGVPPRELNREGHVSIVLEQNDQSVKKAWRLHFWLANVGMLCLVVGFALQLAGLLLGE
jgi:hypothetical protein